MAATFDQFYAFLREHYLNSRFEGRNTDVWNKCCPAGMTYSENLAKGAFEHLQKTGLGFIGPYEAASGRIIKYDINLQILNPDAPREQIGKKAPNLTHIYGQSFA